MTANLVTNRPAVPRSCSSTCVRFPDDDPRRRQVLAGGAALEPALRPRRAANGARLHDEGRKGRPDLVLFENAAAIVDVSMGLETDITLTFLTRDKESRTGSACIPIHLPRPDTSRATAKQPLRCKATARASFDGAVRGSGTVYGIDEMGRALGDTTVASAFAADLQSRRSSWRRVAFTSVSDMLNMQGSVGFSSLPPNAGTRSAEALFTTLYADLRKLARHELSRRGARRHADARPRSCTRPTSTSRSATARCSSIAAASWPTPRG